MRSQTIDSNDEKNNRLHEKSLAPCSVYFNVLFGGVYFKVAFGGVYFNVALGGVYINVALGGVNFKAWRCLF